MDIKEKIKRSKKMIFDVMKILDPKNQIGLVEYYESLFRDMNQKETITFLKSGTFIIPQVAWEKEVKLEDAVKACDMVGAPVMEKISLPYLHQDASGPLISDKEVMVVPITFKVLVQLIDKENKSSSDISRRDKSNQAIGDSKSAMLSDMEVVMLSSKNYDTVLTELLTVRSDNTEAKELMYKEIIETGAGSLPMDAINDPKNKKTLQLLDAYYIGMGLETNLI